LAGLTAASGKEVTDEEGDVSIAAESEPSPRPKKKTTKTKAKSAVPQRRKL